MEGFLYRSLLEACAAQAGTSKDECRSFLSRCVRRAKPYVRSEWADVLDEALSREPTEEPLSNPDVDGSPLYAYRFLPEEELASIVSRDLVFPHLDQVLD